MEVHGDCGGVWGERRNALILIPTGLGHNLNSIAREFLYMILSLEVLFKLMVTQT